jgi:hypothetical protein
MFVGASGRVDEWFDHMFVGASGRVSKSFEHMFVRASGYVGEWFEHMFVRASGYVGEWFEHMFVGASGRVSKSFEHMFVRASGYVGEWFEHLFVVASSRELSSGRSRFGHWFAACRKPENHAADYRRQPQHDGKKRTELREKRGCKRSHGPRPLRRGHFRLGQSHALWGCRGLLFGVAISYRL